MSFNKLIERLSFSISFWSNIEDLYPSDGDAYFEVMDSFGNWCKYIDLLKDISLSKNRQKQDRLEFVFKSKNVYSIRFVAHCKPVGDRNKGSISIGDLIILHYS